MTLQIREITSASNIHRRRLCPGSAKMEAGLPEVENEYSEEGTMLHRFFKTGIRTPEMSRETVEVLNLADHYADSFFTNLRRMFEIPEDAEYIDEFNMGLWLYDETEPIHLPVYPGHADLKRTWPKYQLRAVVDAKFGWLEVDHAADNDQLASYAAMMHQELPIANTGVAIIQPRNFGPRMSQGIYRSQSLNAAARDLVNVARTSELPNQPLIPGKVQCHFCKAKTGCSAYHAKFIEVWKEPPAVATLPSSKLEELHTAIKFAEEIKNEVWNEIRSRIEAGKMPGWKLRNTGDTVILREGATTKLYHALKEYYKENPDFNAVKFDDCREIAWGKLEKLVKELSGLSDKGAKEFIAKFCAPFVTRTPKAKSIMRDTKDKLLPDKK